METANHFCCSSAGMPIWPRSFLAARSRAELYFDEGGKLLLKLCLADDWFLTCLLSGYLGTKEDVQHIVDNRLHRNYFTGLAFLGGINQVAPLFGAVLRPWRLSIRKKTWQPTVDLITTEPSEYAKEVGTLSKAYPGYQGLRKAAALIVENEKLKLAYDYYQTVRICGASGEILTCKLMDGTVRVPGMATRSESEIVPSWRVPISQEVAPVSLSSLWAFTLSLAGVTVSDRSYNGQNMQYVRSPGGFGFKETGHNDIETHFDYDETFLNFYGEGFSFETFWSRLERTIDPPDVNVIYPEGITELGGMTVRPAFVQFGLEKIRPRLKELGIELPTEHDSVEGKKGRSSEDDPEGEEES